MAGSPAIAALVAHVAFWCLLAYGWAVGELKGKRIAAFLTAWVAGRIGLPYLAYSYQPLQGMFSSFVAVLDIALVFTIFKGDVRLT